MNRVNHKDVLQNCLYIAKAVPQIHPTHSKFLFIHFMVRSLFILQISRYSDDTKFMKGIHFNNLAKKNEFSWR